MPFDAGSLNLVSNSGPFFTLWHYYTADTLVEVLADNYFQALEGCEVGDRIMLHAGWGTEHPAFGDLVVARVGTLRDSGEGFVQVQGMVQVTIT